MSTIKANDIQNASGGIPTVKGQRLIPTAWVNFNGTGTVAIRDSENVSSITDGGAGDYTVNFTTAMSNTNYSQVWSAGVGAGGGSYYFPTIFFAPTTTGCGVRVLSIVTGSVTTSTAAFVTLTVLGGQA